MIFFRYSIVTFEDLNDKTTIPAFTDNIKNVQFDLRKIKIDEMPQLNNKYMLTGLITIPSPCIEDGILSIPEEILSEVEDALENASNLLGIIYRSGVYIRSTWPIYSLMAENHNESKLISEIKEFPANLKTKYRNLSPFSSFPQVKNLLDDRAEAVKMYIEAFRSNSSLSRYRDYVRVFENAYGIPFYSLRKKLKKFISTVDSTYTLDEVNHWVSIRDPASHADMKKNDCVMFERDTQPIIDRMENACLDILLNKKHWCCKDQNDRRSEHSTKIQILKHGGYRLTENVTENKVKLQPYNSDCFDSWIYDSYTTPNNFLHLQLENSWCPQIDSSIKTDEVRWEKIKSDGEVETGSYTLKLSTEKN